MNQPQVSVRGLCKTYLVTEREPGLMASVRSLERSVASQGPWTELDADLSQEGASTVAVDRSASMLQAARRRTQGLHNVELHEAELAQQQEQRQHRDLAGDDQRERQAAEQGVAAAEPELGERVAGQASDDQRNERRADRADNRAHRVGRVETADEPRRIAIAFATEAPPEGAALRREQIGSVLKDLRDPA